MSWLLQIVLHWGACSFQIMVFSGYIPRIGIVVSTSLIIREMQIKTIMSYHLTPVRMAIIKNLQTINAGEDVEKGEPSSTVHSHYLECRRSLLPFPV